EGEAPGEGEGEAPGEGEGEAPGEGEGEGEGEPLPSSLPARVFARVDQPVTLVLVLPAGTTLTAADDNPRVDVVVTAPVGAAATTAVQLTARVTGLQLVGFTRRNSNGTVDEVEVEVVVRPADWHVLEADRRLRVRKRVNVATGVADVVVPIRVDTGVDGPQRFFAPVVDSVFADDDEPLPAAPDASSNAAVAARANTTWWVAMPAGSNTVVLAYPTLARPSAPVSPSPWSDYLAVFHLDSDLEDAVSGTTLALPSGSGIGFGTDTCLINGCARVGADEPGAVISTRDLGTHDALSLLATVRSNDLDSPESPLIGVRDDEATTAAPVLGLRAGGGNVAAITLDDDAETVVARSNLQFGFLERQLLAASLTSSALSLFLADRQVNSTLTTRTPAPLTSIVLGNDGDTGGRVGAFVDEIRLRRGSVSVIAARYELSAMKDNASSVEVELAP
ncbi:MAG TPA: hypothetical protein VGF99_08500, partial [Myxococcota bacterium]